MTRPARNRLIAVVLVVGIIALSRFLATEVIWAAAAIATPLLVTALVVTLPFQRARALLGRQRYEDAALELAAFEKAVLGSGWKRFFASLAVGLYTSEPVAAARNTLAAVRLEQGRLDDAATHLAAALERDPDYAVAWANRAVLAAMKKDRGTAEEARLKAAELGYAPKLLLRIIEDKLSQ